MTSPELKHLLRLARFIARKLTGDAVYARRDEFIDAAIDGYLRALRTFDASRGTWVHRLQVCVRDEVVAAIRRGRRVRQINSASVEVSPEHVDRNRSPVAFDAFDALPRRRSRRIAAGVYLEGLTRGEVATREGVSPRTVSSVLRDVRRKMAVSHG